MRRRWNERTRKFVREVGSVVLGVLIALAGAEAVEALRWRARVTNSLAAVRVESGGNRYNVVERRLLAGCVDRRLTTIGAVLHDARRTGRLPSVGPIGRPPIRPVETAAYDVMMSEGTPLHMDREAARDLAMAYNGGATVWRDLIDREQSAWDTLRIVEQHGGPIDSDLLSALVQAHATATSLSELILVVSQQVNQRYERLGIPVEYGNIGSLQGLTEKVRQRSICRRPVVGDTS